MIYSFKWRRLGKYFYTNEKNVIGHCFMEPLNRFVVRYSGGSIKEIPEWTKCEFKSGPDWHAAEQERLNEQAGQVVPLAKL